MPGKLAGVKGVTWEPIWDTIWMPKNIESGDDVFQFYVNGKGEADPHDPRPGKNQKQLAETNCPGGSKLSSDEEMEVTGFALCPDLLTADPEDVATVWNHSVLAIKGTGSSRPFQMPTRFATSGTGFTRIDLGSTIGVPDPAKIFQFPENFELDIYDGNTFSAALIFSKTQKIKKPFQLMLAFFGPHTKSVGPN